MRLMPVALLLAVAFTRPEGRAYAQTNAGGRAAAQESAPAAPDSMTTAKKLYASAAFEEALVALQAVRERGDAATVREVEQYRAYCLLALGRTTEAESAAEAAVRRDPLAVVDARDASPRVVAMFTSVRRRVLPSVAVDSYRAARERMNHGERAAAMQDLERVRRMLDAARALNVSDETLTDLSDLVDGFLELHRAALASAQPPAVEPPVATVMAALPPTVLTTPPPRASTPAAAAPAAPRTGPYSSADPGITPPVALKQDVPEVILDASSRRRSAVIEVTIDERGGVRKALMRESISEWVDTQLLKAARSWLYKPARRNGVPVPYVKVVGIAIGG